jgi:hypothetical protein
MNLIIEICRSSSLIKKISSKYDRKDQNLPSDAENDTYIHIQRQLNIIKNIYHQILEEDQDYQIYKDKYIYLYSGMIKKLNIIDEGDQKYVNLYIPIDTTINLKLN